MIRALTLVAGLLPLQAKADAPLFLVEPSQMPFDLGPAAPANKPSRQSNSPSAAGNSGGAPGNGSGIYANSPDNPANAPDGGRAILADGEVVGYYTTNAGVLNLFTSSGRRVAYRPARGSKSLFSTNGKWCGTVASTGGGFAFGMTRSCVNSFFQ